MRSESTIGQVPRGSFPVPRRRYASVPRRDVASWRAFKPGRLRVVVYARRVDGGRCLTFARDFASIYAEGPTAARAFAELRLVAREVARLYAKRHTPIPIAEVPREDGDELIGSFVIDA